MTIPVVMHIAWRVGVAAVSAGKPPVPRLFLPLVTANSTNGTCHCDCDGYFPLWSPSLAPSTLFAQCARTSSATTGTMWACRGRQLAWTEDRLHSMARGARRAAPQQ